MYNKSYVSTLSELVKIETISHPEGNTLAFKSFHEKIKELFPNP